MRTRTLFTTFMLAWGFILAAVASSYAETATVTGDFSSGKREKPDVYAVTCSEALGISANVTDTGGFFDNTFCVSFTCDREDSGRACTTGNIPSGTGGTPSGTVSIAGCKKAKVSIVCDASSAYCDDDYSSDISCDGSYILNLEQKKDN